MVMSFCHIARFPLIAIFPVVTLLPAESAALPALYASMSAYTPEEDDIESQDAINFFTGGTGTQAFVTEFYQDGGDLIKTYITEGGGTSAGALDDAVESGGTIVINDWAGSGSALARFDRLALDAFWFGTQDDWGYVYGGGIDADARAQDRLTIVGDGTLTYTYELTGALRGKIYTFEDLSLRDVADMDLNFTAEFNKIGSADDASIRFSTGIPNPYDNFFINRSFAETIDLSIEVSDGDVIEYRAAAYSFLDFDDEYDVRQVRGRTDFGSTAELVSVFTSEGVSFAADSGFNYLSVNSTVSDGNRDDTISPVPLPASVWLLIFGVGALGFVRSRSLSNSAV